MIDNLPLALQLAARGWFVFPCKEQPKANGAPGELDKTPYYDKRDLEHGHLDATQDPALIRKWWARWPGALVGIYCEKSGFFALDIDKKGGVNGWQSLTELQSTHGQGANIEVGPIQITPTGGAHLIFRSPDDFKIPQKIGKLGKGLDIKSNGYICSGGVYEWQPEHGPQAALTDAPAWLLDLIRKLSERRPAPQAEQPQPVAMGSGAGDPGGYWLQYYLARCSPGNRNEHGFYLACQLRDSGLSEGEAAGIMASYAARVPGEGYSEREALASLQSAYHGAKREAAHLPGLTTRRNGHGPTSEPEPPAAFEDWPSEPGPQLLEQGSLTDTGNAARLAVRYGADLRWVSEWGWLVWTGARWELDNSDFIMRLAKNTARQIYHEAAQAEDDNQAKNLASWASKSLNRTRLEAMIALAKSELASRPDRFDLDPMILNVKNGAIDLRTGELQPHDKSDLITKLSNVEYNPAASCPTWQRFLERIFAGNQELIDFIRRAIGYSLTGDTSEQVFFFLYGLGANGKSTFANVINDLLGDYAMKARAEVLMLRRFEQSSEETAQIPGVRFLLAAELGEGQRLNEPLIKDLTGGDKLRARRLYHNSFEFYPASKVWLYGNHKPAVYGTDEGIWRRPKLIPFSVTIPEHEQDKRLPVKLRAELPGVLAWAVRGCLEWQRIGLKPPAIVNAATAEFRAEQDIIGKFLDDCCVINDLATITAGELYASYKAWATENGLEPKSNVVFSRQLSERGYSTLGPDGKPRRLSNGKAYYQGLGLSADKNYEA